MCEEEFFYWKGTCDTSCEDISPRGLTTTLGIIAVILVWLILNKSAGGLYGPISPKAVARAPWLSRP